MPEGSSDPEIAPLVRLTGHDGPVHAVTFSAGTGQYLLTGSQDRHVRLFNPTTAQLIQKYSVHGYEVLDIAVAEDNARFVSVGGDKTVFLWDVATAQTTRRFNGHAGRINACSFGGEGDAVIATGSFDGRVLLWDTRARGEKPIMALGEARDAVTSVRVRGATILAGSVDGRVRTYDLHKGEIRVDVLGASVTSVTPDRDGETVLASTLDSTLRLMDGTTGKCLQSFTDPGFRNVTYRLRSCLMAADSLAVSGTEDGRVLIWDVLSGKVTKTLKHTVNYVDGAISNKKDVVAAVTWNQMRKRLASAGGDGEVAIWEFEG